MYIVQEYIKGIQIYIYISHKLFIIFAILEIRVNSTNKKIFAICMHWRNILTSYLYNYTQYNILLLNVVVSETEKNTKRLDNFLMNIH